MLYTIVILVTGVYMNQEYPEYFPSVRILVSNLLVYLRNFRDPIENGLAQPRQNPTTIYEKIVKVFW